ncbi:MAG: flavodoxin family protein, partial [Halanaeroarchaeum sp.]
TARVASDLAGILDDPTVHRIRPRTDRRYSNWLLRSFVPGSSVPIEPIATDLSNADTLFVGSPKWTLSCPPVTEYLARLEATDVPTGVFLTYGGFDETRYMDNLVAQVRNAGADVVATLLVQRDRVGSGEYRAGLESFVTAVLDERR